MVFQKGHKFATGRPKGSKSRETLLREERRAIFDREVSQDWLETIKKLKPEYKADQFMGPVTQKVEVTLPKPLLHVLRDHNSNPEDIQPEKED